jgi:hypothetical protein
MNKSLYFLKELCEELLEDWKAKATPKFPFNFLAASPAPPSAFFKW